jgi:hypothetical protein
MTAHNASLNHLYLSVAYTLRDRMQHLFVNSQFGPHGQVLIGSFYYGLLQKNMGCQTVSC